MQQRFLLVFSILSFVFVGFTLQYNLMGNTSTESPTVLASTTQISPTITQTPTPTPQPTAIPKPTAIPTKNSTPTSGDLLSAINAYRQSKGVGTLSSSGTLCSIAQTRASQQQQIGHLDHSGFNGLAHSQSEFKGLAEILQTNSSPKDATFLVQSGWAGSPGHNGTMLDTQWTYGCGSMAGNFAVFIFARK